MTAFVRSRLLLSAHVRSRLLCNHNLNNLQKSTSSRQYQTFDQTENLYFFVRFCLLMYTNVRE